MKRLIILFFLLLTSVVFVGCGKSSSESEKQYYLYYVNKDENEILNTKYQPVSNNTITLVDEILNALKTGSEDKKVNKYLPDEIVIQNRYLNDKKQLTLNFESTYSKLIGVREILYRAAIVRTLCQIEGVEKVEFLIDNQPLMLTSDKAIGYMSDEDFIDSTTEDTTYKQKTTVSMYFSNGKGNSLVEIPISITVDGTTPLEQLMIEQLIAGPGEIQGIDSNTVKPTLPEGTKLNSVTIKDKICYVDFNSKFLDVVQGVNSDVTIYSVVNLLAESTKVSKVQFSIDGKQVNTYGDNKHFDAQFERNLDIVENKK